MSSEGFYFSVKVLVSAMNNEKFQEQNWGLYFCQIMIFYFKWNPNMYYYRVAIPISNRLHT